MPEINDRESLRDLNGVRLEVEPLPSFVIKQGLSVERLAVEIETQLRRAGVNVFPMGEFRTGDPHLQMVVTVSDVQGHLIASRVEVNCVQICFLRRNPLVTFNCPDALHEQIGTHAKCEMNVVHGDSAPQYE